MIAPFINNEAYSLKALVNKGNLFRLKAKMKQAEQGKPLTIGFIGGSITQGSLSSLPTTCYAYKTYQWWVDQFPKCQITYVNSGIGGTDSVYGVFRVDKDLLKYKPDVVIIEYSVNDLAIEVFEDAYEALVIKVLSEEQQPAVMILNTMQYDDGRNRQEAHNTIAKHYQLPIVSIKNGLWEAIQNGTLEAFALSPDNVHPNDLGHHYLASFLKHQLTDCYRALNTDESEYELPQPIYPNNPLTKGQLYRNDAIEASVNEGFIVDSRHPEYVGDLFSGGWMTESGGSHIVFDVEGAHIAIQYKRAIDNWGGKAIAIIDGDEASPIALDGDFVDGWGDTVIFTTLIKESDKAKHTIRIDFNDEGNKNRRFYITALFIA